MFCAAAQPIQRDAGLPVNLDARLVRCLNNLSQAFVAGSLGDNDVIDRTRASSQGQSTTTP